jgi:hypothetical protein
MRKCSTWEFRVVNTSARFSSFAAVREGQSAMVHLEYNPRPSFKMKESISSDSSDSSRMRPRVTPKLLRWQDVPFECSSQVTADSLQCSTRCASHSLWVEKWRYVLIPNASPARPNTARQLSINAPGSLLMRHARPRPPSRRAACLYPALMFMKIERRRASCAAVSWGYLTAAFGGAPCAAERRERNVDETGVVITRPARQRCESGS